MCFSLNKRPQKASKLNVKGGEAFKKDYVILSFSLIQNLKITPMQTEEFAIYKGLQRPLIFKMFKGRFIYYGAGVLIAGIIVAGLITAIVSSIVGLVVLFCVTVPGLLYVINKQKEGLHNKKRERTIFIHKPVFKKLINT
jgi:hypothetical protein